MNHYCTYFDSGFLIQGVALWNSLRIYDPESVLWVLALDGAATDALKPVVGVNLRVATLGDIEAADKELAATKKVRSQIEYYFTLSPCLPRWLLGLNPEFESITYLDADLFFFSSPQQLFAAMATAKASVLMTEHRFPRALKRLEKWGRYNVGIQIFKNDAVGRRVLDDWRRQCLEWCYDRLEENRFADQKYLDAWPQKYGAAVLVLDHGGVNLAPWNWQNHRIVVNDQVSVDGQKLIVFHFAKFRPYSSRIWNSGQEEFGVMPWRLRTRLYGAYWRALESARTGPLLGGRFELRRASLRKTRRTFKSWLLWIVFGAVWLRIGTRWLALGCGPLGRYSGLIFTILRRERSTA